MVGKPDPFPHVPRGGYRDKRVFPNATRVEPECKSRDESQGQESSEDRIVTKRPDDRSGSSLEADCGEIVELHFLSMGRVSAVIPGGRLSSGESLLKPRNRVRLLMTTNFDASAMRMPSRQTFSNITAAPLQLLANHAEERNPWERRQRQDTV